MVGLFYEENEDALNFESHKNTMTIEYINKC